MNKYYDTNQLLNSEKVTLTIMPEGYGKCYKEYKEVIDFLENKIKKLEDHRDKALCYIDHEINCIHAIINSTNDITTRNVYIDRMQPYIDIKYLLLRSEDNDN